MPYSRFKKSENRIEFPIWKTKGKGEEKEKINLRSERFSKNKEQLIDNIMAWLYQDSQKFQNRKEALRILEIYPERVFPKHTVGEDIDLEKEKKYVLEQLQNTNLFDLDSALDRLEKYFHTPIYNFKRRMSDGTHGWYIVQYQDSYGWSPAEGGTTYRSGKHVSKKEGPYKTKEDAQEALIQKSHDFEASGDVEIMFNAADTVFTVHDLYEDDYVTYAIERDDRWGSKEESGGGWDWSPEKTPLKHPKRGEANTVKGIRKKYPKSQYLHVYINKYGDRLYNDDVIKEDRQVDKVDVDSANMIVKIFLADSTKKLKDRDSVKVVFKKDGNQRKALEFRSKLAAKKYLKQHGNYVLKDESPLTVCEHCLAGIEAKEGPMITQKVYFDDDIGKCEWCEEEGFDELYEILGKAKSRYEDANCKDGSTVPNPLYVCKHCLKTIEKEEGPQVAYMAEGIENGTVCDYCGDDGFDVLYEIRDRYEKNGGTFNKLTIGDDELDEEESDGEWRYVLKDLSTGEELYRSREIYNILDAEEANIAWEELQNWLENNLTKFSDLDNMKFDVQFVKVR